MTPRPLYNREQALERMLSLVGRMDIPYMLGTGDADGPTRRNGVLGFDCAGAAQNYAYGITRHRPGFNRGPWATVSDDINTNSAIEDAEHERDLFENIDDPQPGDLIAYPTIRLKWWPRPFVGHVQMIKEVPPGWARESGFAELEVVHCHGPNGRRPGVTIDIGFACDRHDAKWSKPQHRTRILRVRL